MSVSSLGFTQPAAVFFFLHVCASRDGVYTNARRVWRSLQRCYGPEIQHPASREYSNQILFVSACVPVGLSACLPGAIDYRHCFLWFVLLNEQEAGYFSNLKLFESIPDDVVLSHANMMVELSEVYVTMLQDTHTIFFFAVLTVFCYCPSRRFNHHRRCLKQRIPPRRKCHCL